MEGPLQSPGLVRLPENPFKHPKSELGDLGMPPSVA
jgi:hypothetical protein